MRAMLIIAGFVLCALPAQAETTIRGFGGTPFDWRAEHNEFTLETRNGYFAGGGLETDIGRLGPIFVKLGGEVSYLRSPIDNLEIKSSLSTLGVYSTTRVGFDFGNIHPYTVGGIGLAVNSFQIEGKDIGSQSDPGLGWFIGAGTDFDLYRNWGIGVEYRFMGQDLVSPGDKIANDHYQGPRQHVALASAYYRF